MIYRGGEFCARLEITDEYGLTGIKERAFTCMEMINSKMWYYFLGMGRWMEVG